MTDHLEVYRSGVRRRYRWRYVAGNGRILADSGQGYTRRIDAIVGATRVTGTRWTEATFPDHVIGWLFGIGGDNDHRRVKVVEVAR